MVAACPILVVWGLIGPQLRNQSLTSFSECRICSRQTRFDRKNGFLESRPDVHKKDGTEFDSSLSKSLTE
jgi:hypothetical protein